MADAATRYTFDFPPKLSPPRKGSVSIPPKLETYEEVKDQAKQTDLPPLHLNGDEYMIMHMNIGESSKANIHGSMGSSKEFDRCGNEDEYVSLK